MLDKTWDYHHIWLLESIQLHWWWEIYPSHSESRPHFKDPETGAHTNTIERTWCAVKDSLPKSGTQKYIYQSYFLEYILRKRYFAECGKKFGVFIDWIRHGYLLRPWPRSEAVPRPLNSLCRDQCGDSAGSIHPESRPAEQQALCLEHNLSLNEFHLQGRLYILILVLCFHACYGDVFRWPVFVDRCLFWYVNMNIHEVTKQFDTWDQRICDIRVSARASQAGKKAQFLWRGSRQAGKKSD